jgi:hypothetical protein
MKKIYTVLAAVVLTVNAFAQAPEKMSYQAVMRDASNKLVTSQAVGMQISILQGSVSGTAVYVETQTPTTNSNGLVSLEIGSGSVVSGAFSTIDWSSDLYFIKTETDPTGGTSYTISGTSQLMSVPYALHANTADSIAGGVSITETDPLFGASLASGITALDTANWNNHTIDTDTQLDSTGVASLGYEAGPHTVNTDTQLDSAGVASLGYEAGPHAVDTQLDSVGIAFLGYVAGSHTVNTDTQLDSAGVASLGYEAGPHTMPKIAISDTNAVARWDGSNLVDGTLTDDGTNVGIGTTSPDHRLEIKSNGMGFSQTSPNGLRKIGTYASNGSVYIQTHTNDNLNFATNNANAQMTLSTSGNLGVGTNAPSATLDVEGTFQLLDGTQGAGKVLTSDTTGNASWQDAAVAPGTTAGEMLYWDGSVWVAVAPGVTGQVLTFGSTGPVWQTQINSSLTVQQRLNLGETPKQSYDSGIPLDSLYGKTYQGGLIAYLDIVNGTGLIAAPSDQSTSVQWTLPAYHFTLIGLIAQFTNLGNANTVSIVGQAGVPASGVNYAAYLCDTLTLGGNTDWYLPSKDELNYLWENLADSDGDDFNSGPTDPNNLGGFANFVYWSSTEYGNGSAWRQYFLSGLQFGNGKNGTGSVRAVRAF